MEKPERKKYNKENSEFTQIYHILKEKGESKFHPQIKKQERDMEDGTTKGQTATVWQPQGLP